MQINNNNLSKSDDEQNDNYDNNEQLSNLLEALKANIDYTKCLKQQLNIVRQKLFDNLEKQRLFQQQRRENDWLKYSRGKRCAMVRRQKFFDAPYFCVFLRKNVSKGT